MGVGEDRSLKAPIRSMSCWLLLFEIVGRGGGDGKKANGLKGCVGNGDTEGVKGGLHSNPKNKYINKYCTFMGSHVHNGKARG